MLPHKTGIWRPKQRFFLCFAMLCIAASMVRASEPKALSELEMSEQLKFYAPIQELRVHFTQTKRLKAMDLELKSEGNLHFTKPSDIDWEIEKPALISVKIREQAITIESGSGPDKTTQVLKMSEIAGDQATKGLGLLLPWLKLDAKALSRSYVITQIGKRSFHFVPRASDPSMFKAMDIDLAIDGHLARMSMAESSGDTLEIVFQKPHIVHSGRPAS